MEANENVEPTPEELPTETAEVATKPKKTKILAVVIVIILIVAALAVALGLGGGGGQKPNAPPTAGAVATTNTTIPVGGYVIFKSTSNDTNGNDTIAYLTWYFGDGTTSNGTVATVGTVNHTFQYGGLYWVLLKAVDNKGANSTTEASMIRVTVTYFAPTLPVTNTSKPKAILNADQDIINENTIVVFNATGSMAVGTWYWINATNHSEGGKNYYGYDNISSLNLSFGDGSKYVEGLSVAMTNNYLKAGHYAASLNVTGENGKSTKVMRTVHVKGIPPSTIPIKNPDAFIMATIGEPQYLDPATCYDTAGGEILQNVYESLVWYEKTNVSYVGPLLCNATPTLANGLISSDGLNYTFNLKSGIKMSDGTTMNASDVIYSIQRVVRIHDPDGPLVVLEADLEDSLSTYIGEQLQNYTDQMAWSTPQWILDQIPNVPTHIITDADVQAVIEAGVTMINDSAVKIRVTHKDPSFLFKMAFTAADIVSKEYVVAHGGVVNGVHNTQMDVFPGGGTGPYQFVSWGSGAIKMTRFGNYHGAAPAIKDVTIKYIKDVNTRMLLLKAGDADSIYMDIQYEDLFNTNPNYRIIKGLPTVDIMFVGFSQDINVTAAAVYGSNVPHDFFMDKHVRKAFTYLMNYTKYINNVLRGNGFAANGVIPKGFFGYNASKPVFQFDPAKAEAEFKLAIANHTTMQTWWDKGFTIALMYNSGNLYRETACLYMKEALEALNSKFHATINPLAWNTYLTEKNRKPTSLPIYYIGWAPDYPDPDDYATPLLDSQFGIFPVRTGYHNATVDATIRAAASELNLTKRYKLYQNLTDLVYDDCPYLIMYQANNFHIERAWVHGYYYNQMYSGFYYASFTKS